MHPLAPNALDMYWSGTRAWLLVPVPAHSILSTMAIVVSRATTRQKREGAASSSTLAAITELVIDTDNNFLAHALGRLCAHASTVSSLGDGSQSAQPTTPPRFLPLQNRARQPITGPSFLPFFFRYYFLSLSLPGYPRLLVGRASSIITEYLRDDK
ncbi:hypothetical protein BGW36DRAFT_50269 [Talaromyces proteolyticus]|uniref:Uncharacterized protein n=1 Tax=Talaromyces proteolyticus TaxID=1131652 RepID=A0AAD4PTS4_9EURO|nr:uncharacterized protein BGW36DRAFT_50269 [Talaromyces proteolyticus]KAH8691310.1 hypothetical protein BGW36DRAFT_50269 [Talaromyces proteolyticus]